MISMAPFKMPEVPKPAITRPPINMLEEFASPQIKEPISKRTKKLRNVHCNRKSVSRESREWSNMGAWISTYFGLEFHIDLSCKWLKDCAASMSV